MVSGLPYELLLGVAFIRRNRSIIRFNKKEGFRSILESSCVPLSLVDAKLTSKTASVAE